MRRRRRATFPLTLPDGRVVECWLKDAEAIRRDRALTGNVMLVRSSTDGVYDRVDPTSAEASALAPTARRIG